jgi:four helix bundle protein
MDNGKEGSVARNYKNIKAWQLSHQLVMDIYRVTDKFPKSEIFGLTSQMRRAAVSVAANIAEGSARKYKKEYLQFLYNAIGSLVELGYYIELAKDLEYIDKGSFEIVQPQHEVTIKILRGLINHLEKETV